MKTFKQFFQLDEVHISAKPKAKGEQEFAKSTYITHMKDPGDMYGSGPEEVSKKSVTSQSGKRKADRLDNKQGFGEETDLTKKQTKMAHTIGKEFAKKKVGSGTEDSAYAIATAMVKDKPEAAEKAYKTIKAKIKNEEHQIALIDLYSDLHEENKKSFLIQLENSPEELIQFALNRKG